MNKTNFRAVSKQQTPLFTGYNQSTTSVEMMKGIVLAGKIAIVTGGYSGIGLETVKLLHEAGATIIVPTRNVSATKNLFKDYSTRLEIEYMDLLDPESIDNFSNKFISTGRPLHILINNAGIMACPLMRDTRGFETQFATNHLGHFQLTNRLWEALKSAGGARVVTVSSLGHRFSDIIYNDPSFVTTPYDRWIAYGQSKTANVLFSVYLDALGKELGIRAYSLHPGRIVETNLIKHIPRTELTTLGILDADGHIKDNDNYKSIEQGAATTLFCATSQLLNNIGGVYCENSDIAELHSINTEAIKITKGVLPYAVDYNNAQKLWELSEKLTGITFK